MRRDHRPYFIKRIVSRFNHWYVERFIRPQFDKLGLHPMLVAPRSSEIHGSQITAGDYLHLISHPVNPVRLTTWSSKQHSGHIRIGNYCLISPGVEMTAAQSIEIGDNCMIAAGVVIADSDWHGLYNRTRPFRCTAPVELKDNVWLGLRSIICKGVTVGENSVVGAGAVVTKDIPANVVAAGNPAKVVKHLKPKRRMLKREFLFKNGPRYWEQQEKIDAFLTDGNSFWHWLQTKVKPSRGD